MSLNEEMTKIKIVDLEQLYNFIVENFFIGIHLGLQILIWIFLLGVFFDTRQRFFAECVPEKTLSKPFDTQQRAGF